MSDTAKEDIFTLHLPGGRIARVPASVLAPFVGPATNVGHPPEEVDVTQHSASIDLATGTSVWHTEWEIGQCEFTDDSGNLQSAYIWHRHPLGTEYTEIYQK